MVLTSFCSQPLKPAVEGESIASKSKKGTDYYSGYLQQKVWQSNDAYTCTCSLVENLTSCDS